MRYLAAIPLILLFAILDVVSIVTIFPMFLIAEEGDFPISYHFAKKVWSI